MGRRTLDGNASQIIINPFKVNRGPFKAPYWRIYSFRAVQYGIKEDSETAAYLIGHLVHRMYKMLEKILRQCI